MRKFLILSLLVIPIFAQNPPNIITLSAPPPTGVTSINSRIVGNGGNATYFFTVVANFPIGQGSLIFNTVVNAPNTLTGNNYIQLGWLPVTGATSYDVLSLPQPNIVTNPCTCAIVTGLSVATNSYNVISSSVSSYTYSPAANASGYLELNNKDYALPVITTNIPVITWTTVTTSTQLQAAVNSPGAYVFIPPNNTITLASTLSIAQPNVTIAGAGLGSVIQAKANSLLKQMIIVFPSATGFILQNVSLNGNRSNNGTYRDDGITTDTCLLLQASHSLVIGNEITQCQLAGIFIGVTTPTTQTDVRFIGNTFHDIGGVIADHCGGGPNCGGGLGIVAEGSGVVDVIDIVGNTFTNIYNQVSSVLASGAVFLATSGGHTVISDNVVLNCYNIAGGVVYSTPGSNITGNTISRTAVVLSDTSAGIEILGGPAHIEGNYITGFSYAGIVIDGGAVDVDITANTILCGTGNICGTGGATAFPIGTGILDGGNNTRAKVHGNLISTVVGYWSIGNDTNSSVSNNDLCGSTTKFSNFPYTLGPSISNNLCWNFLGNLLYVDATTTGSTLTNTNVLTQIQSVVMPANGYHIGQLIHIEIWGVYSTANGSDTITLYQAVTSPSSFLNFTTPTGAVTNAPWKIIYDARVISVGSGGTMFVTMSGNFGSTLEAAGSATAVGYNTTIGNFISFLGQWSAISTSDSITEQGFTVEIKG